MEAYLLSQWRGGIAPNVVFSYPTPLACLQLFVATAICRSAHVSGIDNVVCVRTSAAAAHPAVAESAEVGQRVGSESDTATRAGGTDELSPPSCPLSSLFESRCMDKTGNTGRTDGPSFSVRAGDANVLLFSPAAGADAGAETLESAAAGAGTSEADVPDTTAAKTPPKAAPINTATGRQEAGSRDAPGRHDIRGRKGYGGLDQAPVAEANEEILSSESWDFVDVDPFGSCMPFLEAAVQGVRDGGVLAIAATDLAALCGKKGGVSQVQYFAFPQCPRVFKTQFSFPNDADER